MKKTLTRFLLLLPLSGFAQSTINEAEYQSMQQEYRKGTIGKEALLSLVLTENELRKDSSALNLAKAYKSRYIDRTAPKDALSPGLRLYLAFFNKIFTTKDPLFSYMETKSVQSDSLIGDPGFSRWFTGRVIFYDLIRPQAFMNSKPLQHPADWSVLEKQLSDRYGADRIPKLVFEAKSNWYKETGDWTNYINSHMDRLEREGVETTGNGAAFLNDFIYGTVFYHSSDKNVLNKCAGYMEKVVDADPNRYTRIDTYSCILYKLGKKDKAIAIEEKAVILAKDKNDWASVKEYEEKIKKMKNDQPTWL
ncbi:hypothetical protein SAMN05428949_0814 [Chitinophaga sp. YR627]|uniref:hypothetical protein n=1 Tax=Chitinophaga sp. YR627 TaxID=1881041 RepID=UPI0008F3536F|nr:hypothetical protein [Chitinophaga sp. YR627]SFM79376.1 hypothetical protein SAMN05428949_0814 [Chitinophaga sp. YR627]